MDSIIKRVSRELLYERETRRGEGAVPGHVPSLTNSHPMFWFLLSHRYSLVVVTLSCGSYHEHRRLTCAALVSISQRLTSVRFYLLHFQTLADTTTTP